MRSTFLRALALVAILGVVAGCAGAQTSTETVQITAWRHGGTAAEQSTFTSQVRRFNESQSEIHVSVQTIAEGDYNDRLQSAGAAGRLADVVELDGPTIASYAYQQHLVALNSLLPASALHNQLPSLASQGTYHGRVFAVGTFDSGLGLYADRDQLAAASISWPTSDANAWTARQFNQVLATLARADSDHKVLDVKLNYGVGEWLTYGFAPLVASAGGDLLDPDTLRATGHLDGPAAQRALSTLAGWAPYIDANKADDAFTRRRVALSWVGHWVYPDYAKALGKDLLVLPLPDLGQGTKTGQGSWAWAIGAPKSRQAAAATFLRFLLKDDEVLRMADANGAVPGTQTALAKSRLYRPGGPLRLFAEQLLHSCGHQPPGPGCVAVPRPVTPGYPTLTAGFATAVSAALAGHDPVSALHAAARSVDRDVTDNNSFR